MLIGILVSVVVAVAAVVAVRRERAAHALALRLAQDRYAELESAYHVAVAATFNRVRAGVLKMYPNAEAAFMRAEADESMGVQAVLSDLRERLGVMNAATSTAQNSVLKAAEAAQAARAENAQLRVLLERALSLPGDVDPEWLKSVKARAKALLDEKPLAELAMAGALEDEMMKRYVAEHSAAFGKAGEA